MSKQLELLLTDENVLNMAAKVNIDIRCFINGTTGWRMTVRT